jgi:hypothetical protein
MSDAAIYGQEMFSLPHDVVVLPSKGKFYTQKKESIKVGYLTAEDENILMSPNQSKEGLVYSLLRNKIYEPSFDINQLIDVDIQAILIFLRNSSFGPEYNFLLKDPATGKEFEQTIFLESISYKEPEIEPDSDGLFTIQLPKSGSVVKCKVLNVGDQKELGKLAEQYPPNMTIPVVTKKLEKHIVELDGSRDRENIARAIIQLPIADSKHIKNTLEKCEPKLDLKRTFTAPSGEKVTVEVTFGVEFFRPFF